MYAGENSKRYNQVSVNCDTCKKEFKKVKSQSETYEISYCSNECKAIGQSKRFAGENHPRWDSSITNEERITTRKYPAYHQWRNDTFRRDNYTCQCCNDSKGGNLVAHHILNYSEHKTLRTELSNSITLCKTCHKLFHDTYGYTKNNLEQLNKFMDNTQKSVIFYAY
nr:HNH endonuclease [Virgibacillus natechei]